MRQWEIRGITDDHDGTAIDVRSRKGDATLVVSEAFPLLLWTTDACLGFTSSPPPGVLSFDLPIDPSDGDLFDLSAEEGVGGMQLVEAHLAALRGSPGDFRIRDQGRELRCTVWPTLGIDGRIAGTMCVATGTEPLQRTRSATASRAELSSRAS
ncbi:MAG: hypothetical protein WEA10_04010 [Actinomycetota bacterium]